MKINELMVGDWVICKHYQDMPFTKQFGVADFAKGEYVFCEPIPLTEDILVKNGFDKRYFDDDFSYDLYEDDNVSFVRLYDHGEGVFFTETSGGDIVITYVHQLQHLLRLCGIDKEIEL